MISITTDVLIIGGGPAGSTFGNLAARKGWQVSLLEKDEHPRFHIGESLLPMNLPIFEQLGVPDKIKGIGVPKLGADFTIGNSSNEHQTFHFAKALGQSPDHAFEVRRSEFDQLLFEACREAGHIHVSYRRMEATEPEARERSCIRALSGCQAETGGGPGKYKHLLVRAWLGLADSTKG